MSIRLFFINAYLAIEGIFRRCPGTTPCGFLGRSIQMHSGIRGSDSCQEVCVFFLDSSLQCGSCTNQFDIALQLVNVTSPEDQALVTKSRQRWESIVVGDVVDGIPSPFFRNLLPRACNVPIRIDDIYVCFRYETMDEFFATSSALVVRISNDLPIIGEIVIDIDYVNSINGTASTFLEDLILRQFGYALGFGDRIGNDDCPYRGPKAIAEFASLSGCLVSNIDPRFCSNVTAEEEECLGDELMTRLNRTSKNLLSRITVANLEDIGYEVDYTNVDVYTADNINATCRCTQQRALGTTHEMITQASFAFEQHHPRQLSDEVYNKVISYGKMKLAEKKERYDAAVANYGGNINDEQKFVGDQAMTVTVMENGEIYSIVVRA